MDADIIITVCAPTKGMKHLASVSMRTAAEFTDARIIIAANNIKDPEFDSELRALSDSLGFHWVYHPGQPNPDRLLMNEDFNIASTFNHHIKTTTGKYYGCFTQDVIFYPRWLDNLIELWEEDPSYFVLSPWSYNLFRGDVIKSLVKAPQRRISHEWPFCTAGLVFRRDGKYLWDENIPYEADSDLYHYLNNNRLKSGIVYNSRVDHLGQAVIGETRGWDHAIQGLSTHETGRRLAAKWGLK